MNTNSTNSAKSSKTFEQKMTKDGKLNNKYVDLLSEDPPISSQLYGCYSFVSPEKIIKQKDIFMFEKFVKQWQYSKSLSMFSDFMQFLSHKYNIEPEKLNADFVEFVTEEENVLKREDVVGDFNHFMDKNEVRLTEEFQKQHNFQTSVRGFINRGNFSTLEEAEKFAKQIRDRDPNHDIFVGRNFVWTPLDPDAYKTGRIEFMEEELNQLHHEKLKNEMKAKEEFEKRLYDSKRKAIEKNIEEARKSGNKLTQTMNADGNLVGVKETVDFESREVAVAGQDPVIARHQNKKDKETDSIENEETQ
jgi:hypothetical protein